MRWEDEKIFESYLTEGKKQKKEKTPYEQIRKPIPPRGHHHGDKKKEAERKRGRGKVDQDSYEENYSVARQPTGIDQFKPSRKKTLNPNQQLGYATHFEGGGDEIRDQGIHDRLDNVELPLIGSKVEIADDMGGGTGNVVNHDGDSGVVVELENEVIKTFNKFDVTEIPDDGLN